MTEQRELAGLPYDKQNRTPGIDQGRDPAGEGQTVVCPYCGRFVHNSIGRVVCVGEGGLHASRPRVMEPATGRWKRGY